jgi:mono/diheme cytochrome c family protein
MRVAISFTARALSPAIGLLALSVVAAQTPAQAANTLSMGTTAQVNRGEAAYRQQCAPCHRADLAGTERVPPLAGDTFTARWASLTVSDLLQRIQTTMPQTAPRSLPDAQYLDILAFILSANGAAQGADELSAADGRLSSRLSGFL